MENKNDVKEKNSRPKTLKARYIKPVIFNSVNDIDNIEDVVNAEINKLRASGGSIVSIVPHNYGISPMHLIYDIIYESDHELK